MQKSLFDIPVYRLSYKDYSQQQDAYIKSQLPEFDSDKMFENIRSEETQRKMRTASYHYKSFGGAWRYNEIIGFVRIFKFGDQIRAEYWQTEASRIVKTRNKQFSLKSRKLVPECRIRNLHSSNAIKEAIDLCISRCSKKLNTRYLDLEHYELLTKHVDWTGVINEE